MSQLFNLLRMLGQNKGKILLLLVSVLIWLVVLFPFSDLSDFMAEKIATMTNNQIFLHFSNLQISWWPLGLEFGDISVDTPATGTLTAQEVIVSPSPAALFSRVPLGTVNAQGFCHGNLEISIKSGKKSEAGVDRQRIEIKAEHLNLQDLRDVGQLQMALKGQLDLQGTMLVDFSLGEQPEGDVLIQVEKFEIPAQTFNSLMGPINIPDLRLNTVELKGHINAGHLNIEEGRVGHDGDEVRGSIKGGIAVVLNPPTGFQPQLGPYSFDLDLTIKTALEERLNLFLVAVSQFKTSVGDSSRYRFRLSAQNPNFPPSMSALH